jgi:replication initiation and membrane attachment protein
MKNALEEVKSFVDSIASQWVRNKVETVEQAMNLAEKEYKNRKNNDKKVKKTISNVEQPEWFNKNIEEVSVSLDKQLEFEKKLKELRGDL